MIRDYLSYLPSNSSRSAPSRAEWHPPSTAPAQLADIVPDDFGRAYDMRKVVSAVVDSGSFFEIRRDWGRTVVGGLARVEGQPVMIAGNQPTFNAGAIDPDGLRKLTDLTDVADDFGLPIVRLHDLPGVMIGRDAERQGLGKAIVDIMRRLNECTVPRISVVLRKSYGFGWTLMGGYPSGADYIVAWPIRSDSISWRWPPPCRWCTSASWRRSLVRRQRGSSPARWRPNSAASSSHGGRPAADPCTT